MSESGHKPRWIEVGKEVCPRCNGTGKRNRYEDCPECRGSGKRSVGYMDLRDASGR